MSFPICMGDCGKPIAFDGMCAACVRKSVRKDLLTAREEGRREGLEEARARIWRLPADSNARAALDVVRALLDAPEGKP